MWSKQHEAIDCCIQQAQAAQDPIVYERCLEMIYSSITSLLTGNAETLTFKGYTKNIRKALAKLYKTNSSPQVEFAFAKNLTFFGEKEKHQILGKKILTALANRTLSQTLTDYVLQGEATLTNYANNANKDVFYTDLLN